MTTHVMVVLPKPNHNRCKVTARYRNADGSIGDAYSTVELSHGEVTPAGLYVHASSVILIEEIE